MINGYFDDAGAPYLDCLVSIPALGVENHPLSMLVSTGTALTTIHPQDAARMGLSMNQLHTPGHPQPTVQATLAFKRTDNQKVDVSLDRLRITSPANPHLRPTSAIGMDILRLWELHYSYRYNILTFYPGP